MSTVERATEPAMPDWAGEPELVHAPLADGRSRVYYRWREPSEAADARDQRRLGERLRHRASRDPEPWTPEAGPPDSDV